MVLVIPWDDDEISLELLNYIVIAADVDCIVIFHSFLQSAF